MPQRSRLRQPISQRSLDEGRQKLHDPSSREPRTWRNRLELFFALTVVGIIMLLFLFLGVRILLFFVAPALLQHPVFIAIDTAATYITFALMLPFFAYYMYRVLLDKPKAGQSRALHIALAMVPLIMSIMLTIGYFWPSEVLTNIGSVGLLIFALWVRFRPTPQQ